MASKGGDEAELVLGSVTAAESQGQQQQQQHQEVDYHDGVVAGTTREHQGSYDNDYTGEAAEAEATQGGQGASVSNSTENKWNKNGFGQGEFSSISIAIIMAVALATDSDSDSGGKTKTKKTNRTGNSYFSQDLSFGMRHYVIDIKYKQMHR
jgi:hypothetical protein